MRILLDECVPKRLAWHITGHDVHTAHAMGWNGKRNGELLQLMVADGFQVWLTVDQNIRYQQNIPASGVALIVLTGVSNRIHDLIPLVPSVHNALITIQPGDVVEITS